MQEEAGTGLSHCSQCRCSWHSHSGSASPEASIADAYHLDQHKATEADHHMSRLDQPVHGAYEQAGRRESQGRENERIHDATRSQQAHTPGEKLYETQGQKQEGEGDAEHHMREDEAGALGNQEQPSKKLCPYSRHTSDPGGDGAIG